MTDLRLDSEERDLINFQPHLQQLKHHENSKNTDSWNKLKTHGEDLANNKDEGHLDLKMKSIGKQLSPINSCLQIRP